MRRYLVFALVIAPSLCPSQGHPPHVAPSRMTVPAAFQVELVACEPAVRQPVAIDFDDRGRLWVMQYLQYPNPEGLARVRVDRYSRTQYDRVPEPPPRGPKGADRLTIVANDGKSAKDFVSGLNLASGFAFGHGGVFILQVPYLLFYSDRNQDEIPDGDPEVLLTGFGMEDAHSVANSLTWGPDGWLYGCQGSTVTAKIRGIEFQQGVWRYHPVSRKFELFCEGGGNSWGLDFDRFGQLYYSTNHGGYVMLHGVQGGYYWKSFGKHGALHNPHAYGYFDHAPHQHFVGGHVTVGGLIYRGSQFPASFQHQYIGADLLGHGIYWNKISPRGSTVETSHGGKLLSANDTWFAPSDLTVGLDGCVYVADWHDARMAHPDPDATWDRSNGRIYRISHGPARQKPLGDLGQLESAALVELLSHANHGYVRRARRILIERRDSKITPRLRALVAGKSDETALEALWVLHGMGAIDPSLADELFRHPFPHVRRWMARLFGDAGKHHAAMQTMAELEADPAIASQLASTARRLRSEHALPIVWKLLSRDEFASDPHIPLLLWWAIEHHCLEARQEILAHFALPQAWQSRMTREVVLPRLARRYTADVALHDDCRKLLELAPSQPQRQPLLAAMLEGIAPGNKLGSTLVAPLSRWFSESPSDLVLTRLLARVGHEAAMARVRAIVRDGSQSTTTKILLLSESLDKELLPDAGRIVETGQDTPLVRAALAFWSRLGAPTTASRWFEQFASWPPRLRTTLIGACCSRRDLALALLDAVEAKRVVATDVGVEDLQALAYLGEPEIQTRVRRIWGNIQAASPEERLAEIRRLNNDLRAASGDAIAGKKLFAQHCANCHQLFGEGTTIGPDLTHANRADRQFLLQSLVDPSAIIRKEYVSYVVQTNDGRVLSGLLVEQSAASITLLSAKNERQVIPRSQAESIAEAPTSLMPDNLLKPLRPEEVRDLFAYLQRQSP